MSREIFAGPQPPVATGFSERLREAMQRKGYWRPDGRPDVSAFSRASGHSTQNIHAWLTKGRWPAKYLVRIAADLDVSAEWLAGMRGQEADHALHEAVAAPEGVPEKTPAGAGEWNGGMHLVKAFAQLHELARKEEHRDLALVIGLLDRMVPWRDDDWRFLEQQIPVLTKSLNLARRRLRPKARPRGGQR